MFYHVIISSLHVIITIASIYLSAVRMMVESAKKSKILIFTILQRVPNTHEQT